MNRGAVSTFFVATSLSILSLAMPVAPAHAQRDCCFVRPIPPTLIGIQFHGGIDAMLDRLEPAGFQDYDPGRQRIEGLGNLDDAKWPTGSMPPGEISGAALTPAVSSWVLACGPSSPPTLMPMGGHPNGARRLVAVIAVVADLDLTCRNFEAGSGPWHTKFGPAFDDPTLGARVREARLGLATMRVIAPIDPEAPAARWLNHGGPRWIGFAVEVGDLTRTENWLRNEHVQFQRNQTGNQTLRIDPANLDGLLVEFLQSGSF